MVDGTLDVGALAGGFDLQATVESGQSYLWWRADGTTYDGECHAGSDAWYETTTPATDDGPTLVRARQREGELRWEVATDVESVAATDVESVVATDVESVLRRRLGLDDDLEAVRRTAPDDRVVRESFEAFSGMRIVRDRPFPTLVTFICSPQMRVARIHGMQQSLRRALGTPFTVEGRTYHAYPTPGQVAAASEAELRDLGLGYRAPYVRESARMVADGEADPAAARDMDYPAAREYLTRFVGVGEKVADCVLLFSLGFLEAVPLDTWIQRAIAEHFPECEGDSYAETSRAIRERFGPYAGYVQTYVFHYLRTRVGGT